MANSPIQNLIAVVLPKISGKGGKTATGTFSPSNGTNTLTAPTYTEHRSDLFTDRASDDSNTLLKKLFKQDPDVSAAVNAYLTVANTEPMITVYDQNDQIDRAGIELVNDLILSLTTRFDYSQKFQLKPSLASLAESMRYMTLLRGSLAAELVVDKALLPSEVRLVDPISLKWTETASGQYKPKQEVPGANDDVDLNIPAFFVTYFRRDPTDIYGHSHFVAAINTIAARQQVINDLYIINSQNPAAGIDVSSVIEVLNAQNQAGLKVMATVIGRGQMGVNTASVEARVFAMNADDLNEPIAEMLTNLLSLALRLHGHQGRCEVKFAKSELRPETELEPQYVLRHARLLSDLSLGLITDDQYHLAMYGRLGAEGIPQLSGTGFEVKKTAAAPQDGNNTPTERDASAGGGNAANGNAVKR